MPDALGREKGRAFSFMRDLLDPNSRAVRDFELISFAATPRNFEARAGLGEDRKNRKYWRGATSEEHEIVPLGASRVFPEGQYPPPMQIEGVGRDAAVEGTRTRARWRIEWAKRNAHRNDEKGTKARRILLMTRTDL
jgi:hypothetical protein